MLFKVLTKIKYHYNNKYTFSAKIKWVKHADNVVFLSFIKNLINPLNAIFFNRIKIDASKSMFS